MGNGDTQIDIKSEGRMHLIAALTLAMDYHIPGKEGTVSHWLVEDGAMIFGWHESLKGSVPLPVPMTKEQVADLILGWLKSQPYPKEPDIDGHCSKGWQVYQPRADFYETFAVRPYWMEYHK